jgi:ribonuclease HI
MCFEVDYFASTEGGTASSGAADSLGYGTYCLQARTGQKQMVRLDFGRGVTNNEAEYRILIAALKHLVGRIQRTGKSPSAYSLLVHSDSQLLVGQLTQGSPPTCTLPLAC